MRESGGEPFDVEVSTGKMIMRRPVASIYASRRAVRRLVEFDSRTNQTLALWSLIRENQLLLHLRYTQKELTMIANRYRYKMLNMSPSLGSHGTQPCLSSAPATLVFSRIFTPYRRLKSLPSSLFNSSIKQPAIKVRIDDTMPNRKQVYLL